MSDPTPTDPVPSRPRKYRPCEHPQCDGPFGCSIPVTRKPDRPKVGSLFSGIGGLDLGLERAGFKVKWQCEIDKDASRVLEEHWPDVKNYGDVKELDATGVDVLCGGFPCQDVSVAGKRAGLAGERSGLFHEFIRVAGEIAPDWVLIENVPGLLSSNGGRDMGTVVGVLGDLGYGWAYRVLDAQYFGVAQRRRRVFIVGCLDGAASAAKVLFEPESCERDSAPVRETGPGVACTATASTLQGGGQRGSRIDSEGAAGGHLIVFNQTGFGNWEGPQAQALRARDFKSAETLAFHQTQDPITEMEMSPALGATTREMAVAFSENQRGELYEMDVANSITSGGGKPGQGYSAVREGMSVRRLTPVECERLQGFPDGWTSCLADSGRYRTLGNAVCVPVAEFIGTQLMEVVRARV